MATKKSSRRPVGGIRQTLAATFLERSYAALERLSAAASAEVLEEALRAPTDIGGVASLLSDLAPLGQDVSALDPWAEELAEGALLKQELLRDAGGAFSSGEVGQLLGISRQAVDQRARRSKLLAVPQGNGERLYPACQFDENGTVAGLERLLGAFQVEAPWMRLSVLLDEEPALGGRTPIRALREGDIDAAIRLVRGFGEQGAG